MIIGTKLPRTATTTPINVIKPKAAQFMWNNVTPIANVFINWTLSTKSDRSDTSPASARDDNINITQAIKKI